MHVRIYECNICIYETEVGFLNVSGGSIAIMLRIFGAFREQMIANQYMYIYLYLLHTYSYSVHIPIPTTHILILSTYTYTYYTHTHTHIQLLVEFVSGGSIATMLRKFGAFSEQMIANFSAQIVDGLNYLHSQQICHRYVCVCVCMCVCVYVWER